MIYVYKVRIKIIFSVTPMNPVIRSTPKDVKANQIMYDTTVDPLKLDSCPRNIK